MRRIHSWLPIALALILAAPLAAYTIYLKDGSQVVAKEKYRVQNGKAYIVLPNGTESFLDASEIDVPRTEKANRSNYGTAYVLGNEGKAREGSPTPDSAAQQSSPTLSDLIARGQAGTRRPEGEDARAPRPVAPAETPVEEPPDSTDRTTAGFLDLERLPRKPLANQAITTELQRYFRSQGLDEAGVFQGTTPKRPFVEVPTNSEASVFRALVVSAAGLLHLQDAYAGRVDAIELLMTTSSKQRAGQFVITRDRALELMTKKIDVPTFFLHYVQF